MQICEKKKQALFTICQIHDLDFRTGKVNNPDENQEWNHNPLELQDPKICENLAQNSKSILNFQLA